MITIREVTPAEAPSARSLFEKCFPNQDWSRLWERVTSNAARLSVAVESPGKDGPGRVLGFSALAVLDDQVAHLSHLGVDLVARGRGIGSLLLAEAWTEARQSTVNWLLTEAPWPQDPELDEWSGDPMRRWHFFNQRGAILVSDRYAAPTPEGAKDLLLLGFPLRRQSGISETAAVVDWVATLWGPTGHGITQDDLRWDWALSRVADHSVPQV